MSRPTRRTLVRGTAWSVPAVAISGAAPAFAASKFSCHTAVACKTQNRQNSNRWDFKVYLGCTEGAPTTVFFNNRIATKKWDNKGREYWVLERQQHAYTAQLRVVDSTGTIGYDKLVTFGNCPT